MARVFVGKIPKAAVQLVGATHAEEMIRKECSRFGKVINISLKVPSEHASWAYVDFSMREVVAAVIRTQFIQIMSWNTVNMRPCEHMSRSWKGKG